MYLRFFRKPGHAFLLAGSLALFTLLGACSEPPAPVKEEYIPELVLIGLDGAQIPIQAYRGKLLVLNLWATWCPPCRREMPSLERLSKSVDAKRITVAGLTVDTDANLVREFLEQTGVTFRNFADPDSKFSSALDVHAYPETLLIAPDGKIIYRVLGERDWNSPAMRRVLEDAYQGKRNELDYSQAGVLAP